MLKMHKYIYTPVLMHRFVYVDDEWLKSPPYINEAMNNTHNFDGFVYVSAEWLSDNKSSYVSKFV